MKYTKDNYELFALDYLEGKMSPQDQVLFDAFLNAHPAIKAEFEDFELVYLPHVKNEYKKKNTLYRKETHRITAFQIVKIAASILFIFSIAFIGFRKINPDKVPRLVTTEQTKVDIPGEKKNDEKKDTHSLQELARNESTDIQPVSNRLDEQVAEKPKPADNILSENSVVTITNTCDELKEPEENEEEWHRGNYHLTLIEQRIILPEVSFTYSIDRPLISTLDDSEKEKNISKLGKLLARANLIPTGLDQGFKGDFRESVVPETFSDLK